MMRVSKATTAAAFFVGLLGGGAARWATAGRPPENERSAQEIVARVAASRGGLDAWRRVATISWVGRIESARAPSGLRFQLDQARPNKTRLEIDAMGERSVRVFDGVHGWKLSPGRGWREAQPYSPEELRYAGAGHGILGPLLDAATRGGPAVTLKGVDELGDRRTYHLELHPAKGYPEDVWVDSETFLEIRYDRIAEAPGGAPRRVSENFGDYRTVEGMKIPFLISTGGAPGTAPDRMLIESVAVNPPLPDSTFRDPGLQRLREGAGRAMARAPGPVPAGLPR